MRAEANSGIAQSGRKVRKKVKGEKYFSNQNSRNGKKQDKAAADYTDEQ